MTFENSPEDSALVDSLKHDHQPTQGELFSFSDDEEYSTGYRGSVAMNIAGITYRQLDYWARKHIIEPSLIRLMVLGLVVYILLKTLQLWRFLSDF